MKLSNNYSSNVDSKFLIDVFKEGFSLLRVYDKLIDLVEGHVENPDGYGNDEGIILLDYMTDLMELDITSLNTFYINSISGYQDLKRRLSDSFDYYYKIIEKVTPDYEAYLPIEIPDLKEVVSMMKASYGHMALFLVRQFEMESLTLENFKDTVEFSLENACSEFGLGAEGILSLRQLLLERVTEYRPRISVFDEYPDLEDKFFNKVGVEFYDLNYLTYTDVMNVIEDKLDPEDLKRKLNEASGNIQESAD